MASGIYNRFKYNLMKKLIDCSADTFKVALLDGDHAFDADHDVWGDVSSNEIADDSGNGYTAGGATLGTPTATQDDANNCATFDGVNAEWTSATFTASHAVIYDSSVTDNLVCSIDFSGAKSVSSGTFTIQWSGDGIIRLT